MAVILPSGEIVELGSRVGEHDGYELRAAFIGSEGCFGLALDITVKLTPKPQAVRTLLADFMSVEQAANVTSAIVAAGIVPAALEFMDGATIRVVEDSIYAAGYPRDAEASLLIELDGLEAGVVADLEAVRRTCIDGGARNVRVARDDAERLKLWQGRKKAFGAMGRLAPHLIVQDAVIPRTKLPEILAAIHAISQKYNVLVCNVFHAGDGNLHPNIAYSADDPAESERVHKAMIEIMQACIAAGGGAIAAGSRVSTERVTSAIRDCLASETALRISGRGTWLDAGRPVRAGNALSLADDAGVVSYVPGDLTLTVRAGTTLSEIAGIT